MSGQHTQGRLVAGQHRMFGLTSDPSTKFHGLTGESDDLVIAITGPTEAKGALISAADARRLSACWNACEGLPTDDIERHAAGLATLLAHQRDTARIERDQLRAERDPALALLREVLDKSVHDLAEQDSPEGVRSTGDLEELQARIRDLLDTDKPAMLGGQSTELTAIAESAQRVVRAADALGVVLTISQRPRLPLAMGNYETMIEVRPARGCY